jgi:aminoglycoside phosphotransferase family enzyme/predicted kinase
VETAWPAAVRETHVSTVFLVGDRACKVLKAVDLGFLDHSTLELRRRGCELEVAVNRRFAPDVYLGVVTVLGPDGEAAEHGVLMRRLPDDRRLAALLDTPEGPDRVRDVAHRVAALLAAAPHSPDIDLAGSPEAVRRLWDGNLSEMAGFAGTTLDAAALAEVGELAHRYLDGRRTLLEDRVRAGCTRDGHGDLLAEDVFCLPDGPRILDALAFADDLRRGDVVLDVAFLAMDLEHRGHPELARRFLGWFREFSAESFPVSLAHHYVAYRALVRAKVACIRHAQGDEDAGREAPRFLDQVARHLRAGRIRLVLVGGAVGTGKSSLCDGLAEAGDWVVLRSDEVRKELAGMSYEADAAAAPDEALYTPAERAGTYRELLARARLLLDRGERVILDATWADPGERAAAEAVAAEAVADVVALRCTAPLDLTLERLRRRRPEDARGSDATPGVAITVSDRFAPWPGAVEVPTVGPIAESLAIAVRALGDDGA